MFFVTDKETAEHTSAMIESLLRLKTVIRFLDNKNEN